MPLNEGALARTNRWLTTRFAQYYSRVDLDLPFRYTKREWAFLFFDKSFMARHLAFDKRDRIQIYLRDQAPRHTYYSTAFYQKPGAHTMQEKVWKGATLVFDLDADHLPGAAKMAYGEMLAAVKVEFIKLVDRWLISKLGYDADDIHIVFSGGRGYHAHIEDPRILNLDAHERREIVDLVTGKADLNNFLIEEAVKSGKRGEGMGYKVPSHQLPDPERGDWRGDLARETLNFFSEVDILLKNGNRDDAIKKFADLVDIKQEEASLFLDFLEKRDSDGRRRLGKLIVERRIDLEDKLRANFWQRIAEKLYVQLAGEADEPVTADVKRLIRLPSSLHGKTGFVARRMSRDELDAFDPLKDALAFGRAPVEVEGASDVSFELGGVTHHLEKGKVAALPEYATVFACLRGTAQIPSR